MRKAGTGSTGRSGVTGKSGTSQIGKSTSKGSSNFPSIGKLPNVASASMKSYTTSSYKSPKNKSSFGVIWLPTKKRNKHKDAVYNSHRDDLPKDRAPSMYNM